MIFNKKINLNSILARQNTLYVQKQDSHLDDCLEKYNVISFYNLL